MFQGYTKLQEDIYRQDIEDRLEELQESIENIEPVPVVDNTIISTEPPSGIAPEGTEWIMYKED